MNWEGLQKIFPLFRWEKRLLARFIVTALGRSGSSAAVILLIRDFLSSALGGAGDALLVPSGIAPEAILWVVALLLFSAYVVSALCSYDNQVCEARIVKVLELGLMEQVMRHLLSLSVSYYDRQSHGDLIQAVRQDISHMRVVIQSMANILLEGLLAVGLGIAAVSLAPRLSIWAFIALPLGTLPIFMIAKRTLGQSYNVRASGFVLFDVILQVIRGIRIIKAYQGEEGEARSSIDKARVYFDASIELVRIRSLAAVVLESLAGFGIVVVIVVGGIQVMDGILEWPALLAFVMAMRAMHGPVNNMNTQYVQMKSLAAAVDRVEELLATEPEVQEVENPKALPGPPKTIRVEDLRFTYGDNTVLDGLDFEVQAGETIGIAGPSGSGKTTLLNILVRFYDPTGGRVLFDGEDLREFKLSDVYDKVAIVTQAPFIFDMTARENIRAGRPDASDAEVEAAAEAAYIDEELRALPEGYDTELGVGARALSGGQAQRLNVARAILKNAPLMVLDEATSALDSVAEREVQRALDKLVEGRTTFIVAHRLSTLRAAGRILVLDAGKVVGFGPHDELLQSCELYRKMWETQQVAG